jgi:acetylornithine deacetylase
VSERCAEILAELIGYDTQNPGGDELALCRHLAGELDRRAPDHVEVVEVPRQTGPGGYVYARFGTPRVLVNAHVDTVPANTGWTTDPLTAEITTDRVVGLGACDTKGAIAACLVALDEARPDGVGILFSGDEERGTTVISAFLAAGKQAGIDRAIVCEPTGRAVGIRHRGVAAFRAVYRGRGGHSSDADRMPKPIVTLARLAIALDELGIAHLDSGPDDMRGLCMNVAGLDGGVAFNVVPDRGELTWSVRPPPGFDIHGFMARQREVAAAIDPAIAIETALDLPAFATADPGGFAPLLGDRLERAAPLQFWTEAAMLSQAGVDAVVVGPGDIARAHAADEMVPRADLDWMTRLFVDLFRQTPGSAP